MQYKKIAGNKSRRSQIKFGMTPNFMGFTLIELLVVVLIIGILAAVAVPQYRVAVAKARLANLISMANTVLKAEETHYLANGAYTEDWDTLSLSLPGTVTGNAISSPDGWTITIRNADPSRYGGGVKFWDSRIKNVEITFFYQYDTTSWQGKKVCYAKASNTLANALCKNATQKDAATTVSGWNYYYF